MFGFFKRARRPAKSSPESFRRRLNVNQLENRTVPAVVGLVKGQLMIAGTSGNDNVLVQTTGSTIMVRDAGQIVGKFDAQDVQLIDIKAGAGNDKIGVSNAIKVPTIIDGGPGDDYLQAGAGSAILIGGDGNDTVVGGASRDLLIGGNGADTVTGGESDDIVIAGRTRFDDNTDVLQRMLNVWNSDDSYEVRVDNLRRGTDDVPSLDVANVLYDGSADTLTGGNGLDWFLAGPTAKVVDRGASELTN